MNAFQKGLVGAALVGLSTVALARPGHVQTASSVRALNEHIEALGHGSDPQVLGFEDFIARVTLMVRAARELNGVALSLDRGPEVRKLASARAKELATLLHGPVLERLSKMSWENTSCPDRWLRDLLVEDVLRIPPPSSGAGGSGGGSSPSFYDLLPLLAALEGQVGGGEHERTIRTLLEAAGVSRRPAHPDIPGVGTGGAPAGPAPGAAGGSGGGLPPQLRGTLPRPEELPRPVGPGPPIDARQLETRPIVTNPGRWLGILREDAAPASVVEFFGVQPTTQTTQRGDGDHQRRHALREGLSLGAATDDADMVPFALVVDQMVGCECQTQVEVRGLGVVSGARFGGYDPATKRLRFDVSGEALSQTIRVEPSAITRITWSE